MKFYEIDAAILECVDPETGEIDESRLEALQAEKDQKLEQIALWTIELKSDEDALAAEIKRLQDKRTAVKNRRERLRDFLGFQLAGSKMKTPLISVSSRPVDKLVITDKSLVPDEFYHEVVKREIDEDALKEAFNEWDSIQGAHIEHKFSVTVR